MKILFILIVIELSFSTIMAQVPNSPPNERPRNSIYMNLVGDGSILTVNYDRLIISNSNFFLSAKLGIGFNQEFLIYTKKDPDNYLIIPHHLTGNIGSKIHFFELGFGASILRGNANTHYTVYPLIGYRIQPLYSEKLIFRIFASIPLGSYDDLYDPTGESVLFIPFGISLGIAF